MQSVTLVELAHSVEQYMYYVSHNLGFARLFTVKISTCLMHQYK